MNSGAVPPSISVVIPTFNRREFLPATLAPLLAEPDALEVVVVVDGSQDGSYELLQDIAGENPRLRSLLIENRGMTEARLAGAAAARGEIVLLLDDDVRLEPGVVRGHALAHAARTDLVVVGAMPVAGGPQSGPRDYPRAMYARDYERRCDRWTAEPESVLRTFWEGNVSLARDRLLALDPPEPPELGRVYHTDRDFGLRCQRAGLTGVFIGDLRGWHYFSRTPDQFVRDARDSGRGLWLLHQAHPDELGSFSDQQLLSTVPRPLLPVVRLAVTRSRPREVIRLAVAIFGRLHCYPLQRAAAYVLRVTEQLREINRIRRAEKELGSGQ
jgi:glycosyltransferase involved in cell wall biosynthesis